MCLLNLPFHHLGFVTSFFFFYTTCYFSPPVVDILRCGVLDLKHITKCCCSKNEKRFLLLWSDVLLLCYLLFSNPFQQNAPIDLFPSLCAFAVVASEVLCFVSWAGAQHALVCHIRLFLIFASYIITSSGRIK